MAAIGHLIIPLEIDGVTYCLDQQGSRATPAANTSLLSSPTDLADVSNAGGPWIMDLVGVASSFEITFGVGCGSVVNLDFSVNTLAATWNVTVGAHINENITPSNTLAMDEASASGSMAINISDVPCGNTITLVVNIEQPDDEEVGLLIQIDSIS